MKWPTALICMVAVALAPACCNCMSGPAPTSDTGSSVGAQPAPVPASDAPELDVESEAQERRVFPTTDFAYAFDATDFSTPGGNGSGLFVQNNQVLATLPGAGVGQNLINVEACAINQPHVHPRGTEISHIIKGEFLFGFIEENANKAASAGGRFINATVTAGQTFFIPQGLVHFGINQQCEPAQFIASFPTSDPGTVTISSAFFNLPLSALRATLGIDSETIQMIVDKVNSIEQVNPSFDQECLARCNMAMPAFTKENVEVVTTHTQRPTTSQ